MPSILARERGSERELQVRLHEVALVPARPHPIHDQRLHETPPNSKRTLPEAGGPPNGFSSQANKVLGQE